MQINHNFFLEYRQSKSCLENQVTLSNMNYVLNQKKEKYWERLYRISEFISFSFAVNYKINLKKKKKKDHGEDLLLAALCKKKKKTQKTAKSHNLHHYHSAMEESSLLNKFNGNKGNVIWQKK